MIHRAKNERHVKLVICKPVKLQGISLTGCNILHTRTVFLQYLQITLNESQQEALDFYVETVGNTFNELRMGVPNPDLTYARLAQKLDRGNSNLEIPGLKEYLLSTDEEPSFWTFQFDTYKETIPPSVSLEDISGKDLSAYIAENKND